MKTTSVSPSDRPASRGNESRRVTLYLPADLDDAVARAARTGKGKNKNDLMVRAIKQVIDRINREAIDAEIAEIAHDEEYAAECRELEEEFAHADFEALQRGEGSRP